MRITVLDCHNQQRIINTDQVVQSEEANRWVEKQDRWMNVTRIWMTNGPTIDMIEPPEEVIEILNSNE